MKTCSRCKAEKPLDEFHNNKGSKDGKTTRCKPCAIDAAREWAKANPEKVRARCREIARRNKHKYKERLRNWRKTNPEAARLQNRICSSRRRARLRQVPATLTQQEWLEILEQYGHRCLKCGTTERLTIDHVIPISKGGSHTKDNVQPLCQHCNYTKYYYIADYRNAQATA
jgi:5-methylcytosine-specific restriction endonuclease McrA